LGGSNHLPLTFVDNCAEAIVLSGLTQGVDGETFNIVDDGVITSKQFLAAYKSAVGSFFSVRVPYPLAHGFSWAWEKYSHWSKGQLPLVFNRRRCAAEWKGNSYSNRKLREQLGWKPRVPMEKAMEAFLGQFDPNGGNRDWKADIRCERSETRALGTESGGQRTDGENRVQRLEVSPDVVTI
jgi:nucleoside-diphosphate-sugar epimerase